MLYQTSSLASSLSSILPKLVSLLTATCLAFAMRKKYLIALLMSVGALLMLSAVRALVESCAWPSQPKQPLCPPSLQSIIPSSFPLLGFERNAAPVHGHSKYLVGSLLRAKRAPILMDRKGCPGHIGWQNSSAMNALKFAPHAVRLWSMRPYYSSNKRVVQGIIFRARISFGWKAWPLKASQLCMICFYGVMRWIHAFNRRKLDFASCPCL
mmetsp:Transcript_14776/g.32668  ORF Transcript_14776/g.32668 Transcript_14776/m.32668 type:complete len:211 (-) Transcript_14776:2549-3181(-)